MIGFVKVVYLNLQDKGQSMLANFPTYIKTQTENVSSIFEELLPHRFKKKMYSFSIIQYILLLCHKSIKLYNVFSEEVPLSSISSEKNK